MTDVDVSVLIDSSRPWAEMVRIAQAADEAGAYAVYVPDHFMPNTEDDTIVDGPRLEAWTLLSALSQRTSSCRLGALVLGGTYRHPAVVANMVASLDTSAAGARSRGSARAGRSTSTRRTASTCCRSATGRTGSRRACASWRRCCASRGRPSRAGSSRCTTHPTSPHRCRSGCRCWWPAGGERRTLRTAARYADVWHTWGTPESFAAKSAVLDERCAEIGRDPATVRRASGFFVDDLSDGAATVAPLRGVCDEFVFGDVGAPADELIDAVGRTAIWLRPKRRHGRCALSGCPPWTSA